MSNKETGKNKSEVTGLYANVKQKGGLKSRGIHKTSIETLLISVVTVVYNGENDLEKTIQSVINQDYTNIEYIIVDGASQDQTVKIIQRYDELIDIWISEPDDGIYDAMNKGISLCSGDWIIFLNSGDMFYSKGTLSEIDFKEYDNAIPSIIYGNTVLLDEADREIKFHVNELKLRDFYYVDPICHQSVLFSNTAFLENGLYTTDYKIYGDYEWLIRFFKKVVDNRFQAFHSSKYISRFKLGGYHDSNLIEAYKEKFKICDVHFSIRIRVLLRIYFIFVIIRRIPLRLINNNYLIFLYRRIKYS